MHLHLLLAVLLVLPLPEQDRTDSDQDLLTSKTVVFEFRADPRVYANLSSPQDFLNRLDGWKIALKDETKRLFYSTPVEIDGLQGSCKFESMVPGVYELMISPWKLQARLTLEATPAKQLVFEVHVSARMEVRISAQKTEPPEEKPPDLP